jgi:TP901 family phage tail tape measure protein
MPSSAGAIRAGRAYVELFADDSRLVRGLRAASAKLRAWGGSITGMGYRIMAAGAAMAAPFAIATKAFMTAGDQLHKMSARTGMAVETLSELDFAAGQSGTTLEALSASILKMNRRIGRLKAGLGSAAESKAMEELGLSVQELDRMNPEEMFLAIADAMANYGDQTAAAGLAQRAFGTGVDNILPLLLEGRAGIEALRQEARDLGITMSTEDADAAAALTDAWGRLKRVLEAATIQIGAALAPALKSAADWMTRFVVPTIEWIRENRALVVTIAKAAVGIVAFGAAFVVAGTSLTLAGIAVGGFATAIGVVGSVLGVILSPLGLTVAAIAGLVHYSGAGGKALEWLGGKFGELREFASKAWGGIGDAIAAGELSLAVEIAWAGIRVAWVTGVNWLKGQWEEFKQWFRDSGLASVFIDMVAEVKLAWAELLGFLQANDIFPDIRKTEFGQAVEERNRAMADLLPGGLREDFIRNIRPKSLAERKQEIEAERRAAHDRITSGKADEDRLNREQEAQDELNEAQEEYNDLLADAAKKRDDMLKGGAPERPGKLPGIPDFEGAIREAGFTVGTFSKFALAGLGMGGGPAERTARNTERMAKDLEWLRRRSTVWAKANGIARFGK